ncbi:hypothetical protein U3516DRAFT_736689 [Neocallimastix sp. 'constans']
MAQYQEEATAGNALRDTTSKFNFYMFQPQSVSCKFDEESEHDIVKKFTIIKNYGKDVDLWIHDFEEVMDLWDIQNPKRRRVFMKECVYVEENCENKTYPSTQIIKEEIEKNLGITQNDKNFGIIRNNNQNK